MESNQAVMNASFNLMRRLPQSNVQMNIAGLSQLIDNEDLRDEIVQKIDQPLGKHSYSVNDQCIEVEFDTAVNREFLKCEYNRDGDAYRSPWTNKYYPQGGDDSIYPSPDLLALEQK